MTAKAELNVKAKISFSLSHALSCSSYGKQLFYNTQSFFVRVCICVHLFMCDRYEPLFGQFS